VVSTITTLVACTSCTGLILLDDPHLVCFTAWTSLKDLSLGYVPDSSTGAAGSSPGALGPGSTVPGQRAVGTTTFACSGGSHDKPALDLASSLPPALRKLALKGVCVTLDGVMTIATRMPCLVSLHLSDCGLSAAHLQLLADVVSPSLRHSLELVVLHDVPPPTQVARLAASRPPPGTLPHPLSPSTPSWRLWAPDTGAPGSDQWHYDQQRERQQQHSERGRGGWCSPGATLQGTSPEEGDGEWVRLEESADQEPGCSSSTSGDVGDAADRLPWWQELDASLASLALHTLPASLPSLSYLLMGLRPCVALGCHHTLQPLTRLTRLRGLTLQAPGCSWSEEEAAQALRGLTALRSLHLSVGPQGRALGGRGLSQLPYIPA
jgi:hypothetical protein